MTWRSCQCDCHPHSPDKKTRAGCCKCCPEFKRCEEVGAHPAHYHHDRSAKPQTVYLCGTV